ncbi:MULTISPECIES: GIY-YIG nuclease family protein [Acinetobacter calcoaceticus/baumannii complex]|uniref:GIY-YIG nuclease family protein n=1 Tax=Acinetobacter calcoaceticus/baumannii complex TaxID=909768 RepID=UPI0004F52B82|nr:MULTISPECIES: GIY-YIG nuclease family protein [Acinetobacter calcoaceticus/baumannii complex]MBD8884146.1 GIY-YIG nuclease family protein [Acinetobacter baumannii]MBR7725594.1 GIY-YIG nuclease family protein [Acinetobacter nosocomialis]MDC5434135.1 GIY-YIG nuclease family protein [Acinetobacter baumannii]TPT23072.1 hypothetical protein FJU72_11825 [Acinetobacter baumannii]TPT63284.1 hypothetical protein FJU62_01070 [Acinetobacter baumannii]
MEVDLFKQETISTLDLANIFKKRHSDLLRDVRKISKQLNINIDQFRGIYFLDSNNHRGLTKYQLPMSLAITLCSGYSAEIRLQIADVLVKDTQTLKAIIQALRDFEVPDDLPDMYVYYIRNKSTGNVKIGISANPSQRLKQLQTGCDGKLELVAVKKADNKYKDEVKEHNIQQEHQLKGEWFRASCLMN